MKIIETKIGSKNAYLRVFLHYEFTTELYEGCTFEKKRRAMLVIPGGGYNHVSEREAEPIALAYFAKGYEVAILYYSTGEDIKESNPIKEAADAIAYLRALDTVEDDKVSAIGFSAGGHLASMAAIYAKDFNSKAMLNALILSYPVITMGEEAHIGSRDEITCGDVSKRKLYSAELNVKKDFPPTFLWSTRNDATVSIKNSIMMYEALVDNNIFSELHIYPDGRHGASLANKDGGIVNPYIASWFDESLKFLDCIYSRNI